MKLLLFIILIVNIYAQDLKWDKELVRGQLQNGLKYTLKHNTKPENKAILRLIVDIGALEEEKDQLGVAHLVEHMAFNGTKNFKKNSMISYLETLGVAYGTHLNANTSMDRTKYKLSITLEDGNLEKALYIFKEWAVNINFNEEEIEKEKGVIFEEERTTNSTNFKISEQLRPILYANSEYQDRNTIGDMNIIKNIKPKKIKKFYNDWYRPEFMHIVAVGDFDTLKLEQNIKDTFSSLKNNSTKKKKSKVIQIIEKTRILFTHDKELLQNSLSIYFFHKYKKSKTLEDYKEEELRKIAFELFNKENSSFLNNINITTQGISAYSQKLGSSTKAYIFNTSFRGMQELVVLKDLIKSIYTIDKFGFNNKELKILKKSLLRINEERKKEISSIFHAHEISNTVINQGILLSKEFKYKLFKELIPKITVEKLNKVFSEMINTKAQLIEYDLSSLHKVSKRAIKKSIKDTKKNLKKKIKKTLENLPDKILTKELKQTKIKSELYNKKYDYWEFKLENGTRILYKKNTYDKNRVELYSFSYGGTSILKDEELCDAKYLIDMINSSGLDTYSKKQEDSIYADKYAYISPYLSTYSKGFVGVSASKDFDTLLEKIYLYHSKYKIETNIFNNKKSMLNYQEKESSRKPMNKFTKEFLKFYYKDNKRLIEEKSKDIKAMNKNKMLEIYKNNFEKDNTSTYIIVGDIEYENVKKLTTKYLANIPTNKKETMYKIDKSKPIEGKHEFIKDYQTSDISTVMLTYNADAKYSGKENIKLFAFRDILNVKLRELLREEKSGVYSIQVNTEFLRIPYENTTLSIIFDCSPERKNELSSYIKQTIEDMSKNTIDQKYLDSYIKKDLQSLEQDIKKGNFWMRHLIDYAFYGDDIGEIYKYKSYYKNLTKNDIKTVAKSFLNTNNFILAELNPK